MATEAEDARRYFEMAGDALTYAITENFEPEATAQEILKFLVFLGGRTLATLRDNGVSEETALLRFYECADNIATPTRTSFPTKGGSS